MCPVLRSPDSQLVLATKDGPQGVENLTSQIQQRSMQLPLNSWGAFDSAKNHKRQRRKRQSVTAKREKSQTPMFV